MAYGSPAAPEEGRAAKGGPSRATANGGQTWTRVSTVGVSDALFDVWFAARDTGWAVGAAGLVVRTFDRGATWQSFRLPTAFALRGVAFDGTRDGWAVGTGGVIAG